MAEVNRSSRFAIVEEVTEGTPVSPTAAGDYIALQEGFSLTPNFEVLENAELSGSIGRKEPTLGIEQPTASIQHYFRASGTENTAPNFGSLVKSALGATSSKGTERDTVSSSTTSVLNVDTGEGAEFERGMAVLVKDGTNGYSIRPVHSISTDALTLGFNLANAPASGVNLGRAILYKPADTGHQSLSCWLYRSNGASVEMIAGAKVSSMNIEFPAGQYINGSFELVGSKYYFDPIEITSSNKYIDFNDGGGEENASITEKVYTDPVELAAAIEAAMDALTADNITVTYSSSTGKFTIASDGGTLSLLWNSGSNTANTIGASLGFSVAADDTGATTYTSDNAITLSSPQTPSFDDTSPLVAKNNTLFVGDATDNVCLSASNVSVNVTNTIQDVLSICAESGVAEKVHNLREIEIVIDALGTQYDVDKFKRYRANDTTRFMYVAGEKSGGNWVAGKNVCLYCPTAKISGFEPTDRDGLYSINLTLTAFVSDSLGEFYINFI